MSRRNTKKSDIVQYIYATCFTGELIETLCIPVLCSVVILGRVLMIEHRFYTISITTVPIVSI